MMYSLEPDALLIVVIMMPFEFLMVPSERPNIDASIPKKYYQNDSIM